MNPRDWRIDREPGRIGARQLQIRLGESLDHLAQRFGVRVPSRGRHRVALSTLDSMSESDQPLDILDTRLSIRLAEAHRLAWETFVITVAAIEDRRNGRTPFTREKLAEILRGDLVKEGRSGSPRDTQFELLIAAMLRLSGVSVRRGEPDLRIVYGTEEVGVAAKRIRSLNPDQVQKQARAAERQIDREGLRGWIALNLDSRFATVDYSQDEESLVSEFSNTFDSVASALERPSRKPHVLGFFLMGYVFSWHSSNRESEAPSLHWTSPLRWQALTDDPGEEVLFKDFSEGWANRWEQRRRTLRSKQFTGIL